MITDEFSKIMLGKTKINNKLEAMLNEKNPEKIRKYIQNIATAFEKEYQENTGRNMYSFLDENVNNSLFSGAIHTAHAMTCKKQERNLDDVKYWGLGFTSDDVHRLARVNYDNPNTFMFAKIAGHEVDERRNWLKENDGLIITNYNAGDKEAIRAQFGNVLENVRDKDISQKELKHIMNTSPALLQGLLASTHWMNSRGIMESEHEYAGLGLVYTPTTNTGEQHSFDKNQMQYALTTFIHSNYQGNAAGLHSDIKLRNGLIIPFEKREDAELMIHNHKREKRLDEIGFMDFDSPFDPDNLENRGQKIGGRKPGLDDYDKGFDWK